MAKWRGSAMQGMGHNARGSAAARQRANWLGDSK